MMRNPLCQAQFNWKGIFLLVIIGSVFGWVLSKYEKDDHVWIKVLNYLMVLDLVFLNYKTFLGFN
jgi:hypothetical protein